MPEKDRHADTSKQHQRAKRQHQTKRRDRQSSQYQSKADEECNDKAHVYRHIPKHAKYGKRTRLIRDLYASESEKDAMRALIDGGVAMVYQLAIDNAPVDLAKLLKK